MQGFSRLAENMLDSQDFAPWSQSFIQLVLIRCSTFDNDRTDVDDKQ